MRARNLVLVAVVSFAIFAGASPALALGFSCISNNNAGDCAAGTSQLSVDVSDAGGGLVLFTFSNAGPLPGSITDVYFDDGVLQTIESIINSPGVAFSEGATPANLPAAGNISPPFDATFSADSDAPIEANGVNPGETLGIRFSLQSGGTFADVLDALGDGSLRIGIHVQALPSGGSEAFVNTPEPAALALVTLVSFAGALFALVRRRPS
jgi:hypothetical protein